MPSARNYFSNRTKILEVASDVGAPLVNKIQKLFLLKVRESEIKTWPASGDNTFISGTKGQLSLSVANNASQDILSDFRIHDPGNLTKFPIGISVPPCGTLGYFAKDDIPNGWVELGDDNKFYPHKVVIGWIDKANAIAIYANTEFTELYDILDSWGLIKSVSKDNLGKSFNTFDPFRGRFIRALNPACYGPDANSTPLSTANTSLSLHTHTGFNFPTSKFPVNVYNSSAKYKTFGTFSSYIFEVDSTDDIVNGAVYSSNVHVPPIATPTIMNWGDTLILEMNYAAYPGTATPFSIGRYDYSGNMKSIANDVFETNDIQFEVNGAVFNNYTDYYNEFLKAGKNSAKITFSPKETYGDYYIFNSDSTIPVVPLEIRSYENSTVIDKGRAPYFEESYDPAYANRRGATYPNPFALGTQFFYNYQYRMGSTWSTLNEGSAKANSINTISPPFTIRDRQNRIHSVADFDNHIHTRIKTYYRSVLDKDNLDPATDKILDDTTSLFGYANTVYDPSTATDESEWGISQYQIGLGAQTAASKLNLLTTDYSVSPPVPKFQSDASGMRASSALPTLKGKIGVTYKNPFYADATTDPALIKYTGFLRSGASYNYSQVHTRSSHHRGTLPPRGTRSSHHKVTNKERNYRFSLNGFMVFSTEVPSGGSFAPWHILKADTANSVFDNHEFYNTGFDGNYALRTTFAGDHRHQYMIANTHYRGDGEFRPLNIALRLCVKY